MPTRDRFDANAHISARYPETKVVVIALFDAQNSVVRALEAGACGYVSKQADPNQILGAVDAVTHEAQWLGAGVARPPIYPANKTGGELLPGLNTARARDRRPGQPRTHQPDDRRAPLPVNQNRRQLRVLSDAQTRCFVTRRGGGEPYVLPDRLRIPGDPSREAELATKRRRTGTSGRRPARGPSLTLTPDYLRLTTETPTKSHGQRRARD